MADNKTISDGISGVIPVATDEIGGADYQRIKVTFGTNGVATDVSAVDPLPVTGAITVAGTMPVSVASGQEVDGHSATLGTTTDAAATTTGSVIAQLRRVANLLAGTLTVGLPSGASTAAKQPALGTAGTASADVITVQGKSGMTPLDIQGSITASGTFPVDSSKVEDAAHASGDTGAFVLAVRNDAGTALAGTTGDYIPLSTDSSGNLRVTGGGGGTQFAEDAAHTTGDLGTMALAVRKDTATALSGTDGDYTPLITDASGRLHVNVGTSALPTGAATETSVALSATALGAPADAAATTTGSVIAQLRRVANLLAGTLTISGAVTNAGTFAVQPTVAAATTATLTNTAASASNVANLVALNTNRTGLLIHNDSSAILYIKYGTTASTSSFTVLITANTLWEMPASPRYTGRIDGIWASATGNARITELAP